MAIIFPLFCFIMALFLSKLIRFISRSHHSKLNLPPSPPKLPIIGNLHQIGTLPHRSFGSLSQKYGPIFFLNLGHTPTVVGSSPKLAYQIMKTHDLHFADRPQTTTSKILVYGCTDIAFAPYGENWRLKKKICANELLNLKRVQSFHNIREEEVGELVNKIRGDSGKCVNLSELLIATSNDIVCKCVLGDKFNTEGNRRISELARKVMIALAAFSVGDYFPSLAWIDVVTGHVSRTKALFKELDEFFDQVIEDHKNRAVNKKDDDDQFSNSSTKSLLDVLLQLQHDGSLDYHFTQDDLKSILMDMFVGGTDPSSTALEWAMAELNCVVKEILRLHPPPPLVAPRVARSDVELNGYNIPANTTIYINSWAIHRDPEFWERPEEFLPERFEEKDLDFNGQHFHFIPFGSGRRRCPGILFGMAYVKCMLANLLYWFDWKLPHNVTSVEDIDMRETFGLVVSKKVPLHLQPIPYCFGW